MPADTRDTTLTEDVLVKLERWIALQQPGEIQILGTPPFGTYLPLDEFAALIAAARQLPAEHRAREAAEAALQSLRTCDQCGCRYDRENGCICLCGRKALRERIATLEAELDAAGRITEYLKTELKAEREFRDSAIRNRGTP